MVKTIIVQIEKYKQDLLLSEEVKEKLINSINYCDETSKNTKRMLMDIRMLVISLNNQYLQSTQFQIQENQ